MSDPRKIEDLKVSLDREMLEVLHLLDARAKTYTPKQREALLASVAVLEGCWQEPLDLVEAVRTLLLRLRIMAYMGREWLEREAEQFERDLDFNN